MQTKNGYIFEDSKLKKEKEKRSQCGVQKAHTLSTHFPSAWRAAACFLTVCKIELDTVGNLTSRQTCIFFTPQVLVFPVFSLLFFPSSFSQLQLPSDIVSALSSSIFTISPLYPPPTLPTSTPGTPSATTHFLLLGAAHTLPPTSIWDWTGLQHKETTGMRTVYPGGAGGVYPSKESM